VAAAGFEETQSPLRRSVAAMQTRITREEMDAAARQLAKTDEGRRAMQRLLQSLEADELDLDLLDQRAYLALLGGAWKGSGAIAREAIRGALESN
jgi:hypothetical protein